MYDNDIEFKKNNINKELMLAVKENNTQVVLELLKNGANPNYEDENEESLLKYAVDNFPKDEEKAEIILKYLLDYGADPLITILNDLIEYPLFVYALEQGCPLCCFKLLYDKIEKDNKLDEISLVHVCNSVDPYYISFLLEKGIHKDALQCLDYRIAYIEKNHTEPSKFEFGILKSLYDIACKNTVAQYDLDYLLQMALFYHDFEFAYHLAFESKFDLSKSSLWHVNLPYVYSLLGKEGKFSQIQEDKKFLALLISFLQINSNLFYFNNNILLSISNIPVLFKNRKIIFDINAEVVKVAQTIVTKLYETVIKFLNPFDKILHKNSDLEPQLKLAEIYLRNEIGSFITALPSNKLFEILIDRIACYYYVFQPNLIAKDICSSNLILLPTENIIAEYVLNSFAYSDDNRCKLISFLKTIKISNLDMLSKVVRIYIRTLMVSSPSGFSSNLIDNNDDYSRNIVVLSGLNYSIKTRNEAVFNRTIKVLNACEKDIRKVILKLKALTENEEYLNLDSLAAKWYFETIISDILKLKDMDLLKIILDSYSYNVSLSISEKIIAEGDMVALKLFLSKSKFDPGYILEFLKHAITLRKEYITLFLIEEYNNKFSFNYKFNEFISSNFLNNEKFCSNYLNIYFLSRIFSRISMAQKVKESVSDIFKDKLLLNRVRFAVDVDIKTKRTLAKYSQIKIGYKKLMEYLSMRGEKVNKQITCFEIAKENYKELVNNLSECINIPKQNLDNFVVKMQVNPLTKKHEIITAKEKIVYKTLMMANWKLTHLVRLKSDLDKIIEDKEIRSISYRKRLGLSITNQMTPSDINSDEFVFATLGPEKAPRPNFLKYAGGIEIDINKLIKRYPNFFKDGFITYHWSAFKCNQEINPINFMGTVLATSHDKNYQYNDYIYPNGNHWTIKRSISEGLYGGKGGIHILHILSLLFIERIRLIGGKFYQFILENSDNIQIMSDAFCEIMHPGLIEFRYPYCIPLNENYISVKEYPELKDFSENDISKGLDDLVHLKQMFGNGFNPNQLVMLPTSKQLNTYPFVTFLTRAIIEKKYEVVEYLLKECNVTISWNKENNPSLLPIEAAFILKDFKILQQITSELFSNNLFGMKRMLITSDFKLIITYLDKLPFSELLLLSECKDIYFSINLLESLIAAFRNGANEDQVFTLYNQVSKNIPYRKLDVLILSFLEIAISKKATTLINFFLSILDLKNISITYYFIECIIAAITSRNLPVARKLIETNLSKIFTGSVGAELSILYLDLFIEGEGNLFRNFLCLSFPDEVNTINSSTLEDLALLLITKIAKLDSSSLEEKFIIEYNEHQPYSDMLEQVKRFGFCFNIIYQHSSLQPFRDSLTNANVILCLRKALDLDTDIISITDYLKNSNIKNKLTLLANFLLDAIDMAEIDEIEDVFPILETQPEFILFILKKLSRFLSLSVDKINLVFDLMFNNLVNHVIHRSLRIFIAENRDLADEEDHEEFNFVKILEFLIHSNNLDYLSKFLMFIVDDESIIKYFLLQKSEKICNFIKDNADSILTNLSIFEPRYIKRVEMLLLGLGSLKNSATFFTCQDILWAKRVGITQFDLINASQITPSHWEKYNLLKKLLARVGDIKRSAAIFITCYIDNKPYIFMGRKKSTMNTKLPLMAPGGFIDRTDTNILAGALREAREETQINISLSEKEIEMLYSYLKVAGHITENVFNYSDKVNQFPTKITLLHKYKFQDSYNRESTVWNRNISFFWFEFNDDISQHLVASDDFTDGTWVALSEINYHSECDKYYYNNMEILSSNAMLIEMLQGKTISKTLLNEKLYEEIYTRFTEKIEYSKNFIRNSFLTRLTQESVSSTDEGLKVTPSLKRTSSTDEMNVKSKNPRLA